MKPPLLISASLSSHLGPRITAAQSSQKHMVGGSIEGFVNRLVKYRPPRMSFMRRGSAGERRSVRRTTVYHSVTGSGPDKGQPFPSINTTDNPTAAADGSSHICFGPASPGAGKNWLRTLPGKGFFVIFCIYGPTQAICERTWKPSDIEKTN